MATPTEARDPIPALIEQGFSPELFAACWAAPDADRVRDIVTDDVVGHWPGREPVRGHEAYVAALAELLRMLPDLTLTVDDHATRGDVTFLRWTLHATGADGPFTLDGVDCVRTRDGLVCENHIVFDSAALAARAGVTA